MNISQHKADLADMGCIITGSPCHLHHARSGSMSSSGIVCGRGQRPSDWLMIPLSPDLHTGANGIHTIGVKTWERRYGYQVSLLWKISDLLGYNVFEQAGFEIERI